MKVFLRTVALLLALLARFPAVEAGPPSTKAYIEFAVTPGDVEIFLDGKRLGIASNVGKVATKPGMRVVRLQRGEDETSMALRVDPAKTLRFAYEFGD